MEEDEETTKAIPPWVELEHEHMRTLAGPDAHVQFTSFSTSTPLSSSPQDKKAQAPFHLRGMMQRMLSSIPLDKICLLDPKAEKELAPEDGDGRFEWFLFGVCDDPPRDRTSELRVRGFHTRHLSPIQMTTDTALGVTRLVVQDRIPLKEIPYIDQPTIRFNVKESVEMPFRYISNDIKEPRLPPGMKELLQEDLNKTFDF
ncbi:hypothetical protein CPB84DRAFT_1812961 [Gymnopilus junonius]|uniref:Uncharacterized protein n=1 Tax=Gymnopilus junonius TaxID=109634 RepID=A0A9P5TSM4_GYMJU|nr:hypothetical protein CPB84DRAFT_1812961 [Gymnopilus junonius]